MRISEHLLKISLNINIFGFKIDESFELDISNPDNSPEEFAADLVADLLLIGSTSIAYKDFPFVGIIPSHPFTRTTFITSSEVII